MLRIAAGERGSRQDNFQFPYFLSLSPSLFVFTFISVDLAVSDFRSVLRPALYVKWLKCQPSLVKFYLSPGFCLSCFSVSLLWNPIPHALTPVPQYIKTLLFHVFTYWVSWTLPMRELVSSQLWHPDMPCALVPCHTLFSEYLCFCTFVYNFQLHHLFFVLIFYVASCGP